MVYLSLMAVIAGLNFGDVIQKGFPQEDHIRIIDSLLFYLIPGYLIIYSVTQRRNFGLYIHYLHLPVKRSSLAAHSLFLKFFNHINILIAAFLIPFSITSIPGNGGIIPIMMCLAGYLLYIICLTNISFFIHTFSSGRIITWSIILFFTVFHILAKSFFKFEPGTLTANFFIGLQECNYGYLVVLFLVAVILTFLSLKGAEKSLYRYYEKKHSGKYPNRITSLITRLSVKSYLALELRMIFRNKRIRQILIIILLVIIQLYFFLLTGKFSDPFLAIFWCLVGCGIWEYSYLQFVFSWESTFMDLIMSIDLDLDRYLLAKYSHILAGSILLFLILIPPVIAGLITFHILFTAFLYNISVGLIILTITGVLNKKRMDLGKGLLFNYEGSSFIQIIAIYATIAIPIGLMVVLVHFLSFRNGLFVINILSILVVGLNKKWLLLIRKLLARRKYINMEGYRK